MLIFVWQFIYHVRRGARDPSNWTELRSGSAPGCWVLFLEPLGGHLDTRIALSICGMCIAGNCGQ